MEKLPLASVETEVTVPPLPSNRFTVAEARAGGEAPQGLFAHACTVPLTVKPVTVTLTEIATGLPCTTIPGVERLMVPVYAVVPGVNVAALTLTVIEPPVPLSLPVAGESCNQLLLALSLEADQFIGRAQFPFSPNVSVCGAEVCPCVTVKFRLETDVCSVQGCKTVSVTVNDCCLLEVACPVASTVAIQPARPYLTLVSPAAERIMRMIGGPLNGEVCDVIKQSVVGDEVANTAGMPDDLKAAATPQLVGVYHGAAQYSCGVLRPAGACMMRNDGIDASRFCAVCSYTLIEQINPEKHEWFDREYQKSYPL